MRLFFEGNHSSIPVRRSFFQEENAGQVVNEQNPLLGLESVLCMASPGQAGAGGGKKPKEADAKEKADQTEDAANVSAESSESITDADSPLTGDTGNLDIGKTDLGAGPVGAGNETANSDS
jgi:hypothetical protein